MNARTSKSLALAKCVWSKIYGGLRALLENWKRGGGNLSYGFWAGGRGFGGGWALCLNGPQPGAVHTSHRRNEDGKIC